METIDLELPAFWYLDAEPETLAYQLARKGLPRLADLVAQLMFRVSELESELETTREQLETIERLEEHRDREEDILRAREAQLIEIIKELEKANKKGKTA